MANILVTGGTGTLGQQIVGQALQAHQVRVLSRRQQLVKSPDFDWATGDLISGNGVFQSLEGIDIVLHCATSNSSKDVAGARNLLAAARSAGTPHLIYVSIVGVDRIPLGYYRAKREVENLFESSGLGYTILRATQFHDLVVKVATFQSRLPVVPVLKETLFQPVSTRDVAARLLDLAAGTPEGRVDDFGGPEVIPMRELVAKTVAAAGKHRRIVEIKAPGAVARGYANGYHLAPDHRDGVITFDEFLTAASA